MAGMRTSGIIGVKPARKQTLHTTSSRISLIPLLVHTPHVVSSVGVPQTRAHRSAYCPGHRGRNCCETDTTMEAK
ncbi:hypothetical protein OE88DRAFT_1655651 [Heliocybe sulcata]|uniref:Uncharacterized protein n=1 Tax=Heliocybe sulcata TaxID=5364 RepID=A0A5C3N729_9AGAM|nr:hypothetical protein OE88DRAFT_1655651 [Heliocybe sulcata]